MVSTLGDAAGEAKGDLILIDGATFTVKGRWPRSEEDKMRFGYDFWYPWLNN